MLACVVILACAIHGKVSKSFPNIMQANFFFQHHSCLKMIINGQDKYAQSLLHLKYINVTNILLCFYFDFLDLQIPYPLCDKIAPLCKNYHAF